MTQQPDDLDEQTASDPKAQREVSLILLIPNMVTLIGLCFGLTGIRFALEGHYSWAVFLIMLSALADLFDGLLARRLGAQSEMGAQLDSLSDFLCFGVAPAILVYEVHLGEWRGLGWIFALIFAVSACLRLARFNVMSGQADPNDSPKRHFVGVPRAPRCAAWAAAGLSVLYRRAAHRCGPGAGQRLACLCRGVDDLQPPHPLAQGRQSAPPHGRRAVFRNRRGHGAFVHPALGPSGDCGSGLSRRDPLGLGQGTGPFVRLIPINPQTGGRA